MKGFFSSSHRFHLLEKMVLAACLTLCSVLMDGCKGMVHTQRCH